MILCRREAPGGGRRVKNPLAGGVRSRIRSPPFALLRGRNREPQACGEGGGIIAEKFEGLPVPTIGLEHPVGRSKADFGGLGGRAKAGSLGVDCHKSANAIG